MPMEFTAPDWLDANAYPSYESQTAPSFWAWQFLRRNKGYQAEWASYVASLEPMFERTPAWRNELDSYYRIKSPGGELARQESIEFWSCVPAVQPGEFTLDQYLKRGVAKISSWQKKTYVLGKKWGIEELQSPGLDTLARGNRFLVSGATAVFIGHDRSKVDDVNYVLQQFDLRLPVAALEAQFALLLSERARRIDTGQVVARDGRLALAKYANYLRVLDAIDAGATSAEIAKVLLSHQDDSGAKQSVENWKKAAIKLRDENYRGLAASVPKAG